MSAHKGHWHVTWAARKLKSKFISQWIYGLFEGVSGLMPFKVVTGRRHR